MVEEGKDGVSCQLQFHLAHPSEQYPLESLGPHLADDGKDGLLLRLVGRAGRRTMTKVRVGYADRVVTRSLAVFLCPLLLLAHSQLV